MKTIHILHLYSETLDLYGDYFNVACIKNHLEEMGCGCVVRTVELGEAIDPADADLLYIGHGKARNLAAVAEHFSAYAGVVNAAVEAGKVFLVTGNARLLFGRSFVTLDGRELPGSGLFSYTGVDTGKVFTADIYGECAFDRSIAEYGFVNRTQYLIGQNEHPLFYVRQGPGDGEVPDGTEGTLYKNFFGTWQMGPLLPRNPAILRELLHRLLGDEFCDYDDALERRALALTLSEFKL